jgi:hypothetical protein
MSEEQIENIVKDIIKENINSGIQIYDLDKLDNIQTDPIINKDEEITKWSNNDDSSDDSIKKPIKREVKEKKETKTFKQRCIDDPEFYKKTKERLKEKVRCQECNCEISKSSVSEHRYTKRHLRNLENKEYNTQIQKVNKLLELMEQLTILNQKNDDVELEKKQLKKDKKKPTSIANAQLAREGKLKNKLEKKE